MKLIIVLACALCVTLISSTPLPEGERFQSEALDRLVTVEGENEIALRRKRTIGILKELFPEISQMVEQKVNSIAAEFIRVLGPSLLRNFLGNNSAARSGGSSKEGSTVTVASPFDDDDFDVDGTKSTSSNGRVSISLPTYPPDEVEDSTTTTESSVDEAFNIADDVQNAGMADVSDAIA